MYTSLEFQQEHTVPDVLPLATHPRTCSEASRGQQESACWGRTADTSLQECDPGQLACPPNLRQGR